MFNLFRIFSQFDLFRVPEPDYAAATTLLEIVTEDGVMITTEDGVYWGVVS